MDRAVAFVALALTSPAVGVRAVRARLRTGRAFGWQDAVGRGGEPFRLWHFADETPGSGLLVLVAIVCGHMRFVGPRPMLLSQAERLSDEQGWRLAGAPGLFSAYRLQQQTGIAYDSEHDLDRALVADQSLTNPANLGLVARSIVARILGGASGEPTPEQLTMLDVRISNITMRDALEWIFQRVHRDYRVGKAATLFFVNPGCLNIAVEDRRYRSALHNADLVLPDGIGIKLATRMQHVALRENVNGTDMFPRLCERAAAEGIPLFLLGAREGVAEAAADSVRQRFPGLVVAGSHHGYIAGQDEEIIARVNASGARILLVAMGVPQQELWIEQMRPRLRPPVVMGVGGLFDFYAGRIPRAPLWLREIGMEWVWRLAQEPGRMWRRYLIGNPVFLFRVWRDQCASRPSSSTERLAAAASTQAAASARAVAAVIAAVTRRRPEGTETAELRADRASMDS